MYYEGCVETHAERHRVTNRTTQYARNTATHTHLVCILRSSIRFTLPSSLSRAPNRRLSGSFLSLKRRTTGEGGTQTRNQAHSDVGVDIRICARQTYVCSAKRIHQRNAEVDFQPKRALPWFVGCDKARLVCTAPTYNMRIKTSCLDRNPRNAICMGTTASNTAHHRSQQWKRTAVSTRESSRGRKSAGQHTQHTTN